MRSAAAAIVLAIIVVASFAYAGRRLWLKSDDLLRPVVVLRGDDARPVVQPGIGDRIAVLVHGRPSSPQGAHDKLIALTFDDGPYPVTTPLLLQTLHDLRVPATFFLIGRDAEQYPALTRAIAAAGHEIGDHTLTHPNLDQLDPAAVTAELRDGAAMLREIAPERSEERLFRPPHGRFTLATILAAQAAGYDTILWDDDAGDWRDVSTETLRAHVLKYATAPEILLLHSGRLPTIAMLPDVVARFRTAGYQFVTVGALLGRTSPEALARPTRSPLPSGT